MYPNALEEVAMRVWNKRDPNTPKNAVYIGRPSKYGNPYILGLHGDRDRVIAWHMAWVRQRLQGDPHWLDDLLAVEDVVCFCAPLACHGDNYAILVEEMKNDMT